ncbi:MAG: hypothetical protein AB7G93_19810 [Bdellovibrionales bacterium]
MQARNLMITAISAVLLVGGAACSKKKKKHSPAPAPAPVKADGKTEPKVGCSNLEGQWKFAADAGKESIGQIEYFSFERKGNGELHWNTHQLAGVVNVNGKDQKHQDKKTKEEQIINAICVEDRVFMEVKDAKGTVISKFEWRASGDAGRVIETIGDRQQLYMFSRHQDPAPTNQLEF